MSYVSYQTPNITLNSDIFSGSTTPNCHASPAEGREKATRILIAKETQVNDISSRGPSPTAKIWKSKLKAPQKLVCYIEYAAEGPLPCPPMARLLISLFLLICLCGCGGCGAYGYRRRYYVQRVQYAQPVTTTVITPAPGKS